MDTSWTILASCLFLQLHPIRGLPKGQAHQVEDVYASPGKDVDLTCHIQKEIQLVQAQWDVITDREALIAVHHPNLGFYCDGFAKNSCTSSVTFSRTSAGGAEWVLHLRNVSSSLSGKYKCSITTFPTGIWTIIKNLHVQAEEMRGNRTIDAEFNQTLEIPCLDDKSENLLGASILWLTEQNGAREVPLGPDSRIETQLPRDRLGLREDHRLVLSPVQTHDHDRRFTCQATLRSGKVLKSITTLKVWAKPEVFITQQNTSTGLLGGVGAHCWVRNVFPSARVTWYMDGEVLDGRNLKGLITTTEESRSHGGLSVLKSTLELRPALSESRRLWCVALFPGPGGEVRNVSSRRMALSMVEWTSSITSPPADEPEAGLEATDATANWPDSSAPTAGLTLSSARTSGAPLSTAYNLWCHALH
uniref:Ig-like domain-containing protein n=1 Tax=Ornithorhynchus anatinus TaxID=9258 RepID=A0A6I8NAY4_ORNAN